MTISLDQLGRVPVGFDHEALAWEAQGIYQQPRQPVQAWYQDATVDESTLASVLAPSREACARGKRIARLAAFTDPPTDYHRYQLDAAPHHEAAGEQLGWIDEQTALELDMPDEDFWLLDQQVLLRLRYDDWELVGAKLCDDPATVECYRARLNRAWRHAGSPLAAWQRWPDTWPRGAQPCAAGPSAAAWSPQ